MEVRRFKREENIHPFNNFPERQRKKFDKWDGRFYLGININLLKGYVILNGNQNFPCFFCSKMQFEDLKI